MKELKLGMNQPITRRDFISGAAVSISGSLIWPYAEAANPIQGTATLVNSYPRFVTVCVEVMKDPMKLPTNSAMAFAGTTRKIAANATTLLS